MSTKPSHHQRLTHQRRLVLEIIENSQEHPDAEAILLQARARDARISLATVYRALAFLKEAGLVQEHSLGQGHGHFEVAQSTPHYHFTCKQCARVIEFSAPEVIDIVRGLGEERGLQVTDVHLLLSGICDRCRSSQPALPHLADGSSHP